MSLSRFPAVAPRPQVQYLYVRGARPVVPDLPRMDGVQHDVRQFMEHQVNELKARLAQTESTEAVLRQQLFDMIQQRKEDIRKMYLLEEELRLLQDSIDKGKLFFFF